MIKVIDTTDYYVIEKAGEGTVFLQRKRPLGSSPLPLTSREQVIVNACEHILSSQQEQDGEGTVFKHERSLRRL